MYIYIYIYRGLNQTAHYPFKDLEVYKSWILLQTEEGGTWYCIILSRTKSDITDLVTRKPVTYMPTEKGIFNKTTTYYAS